MLFCSQDTVASIVSVPPLAKSIFATVIVYGTTVYTILPLIALILRMMQVFIISKTFVIIISKINTLKEDWNIIMEERPNSKNLVLGLQRRYDCVECWITLVFVWLLLK